MMTHKNPNSPTSLTEFAPHSDDVRQSSGLLSRLFRRNTDTDMIRADSDPVMATDVMTSSDVDETGLPGPEEQNGQDLDCRNGSSACSVPLEPPARTLPSVLMRLKKLIGSSQTPQAYKDSDFRQFWMPDSNCHQCYECGRRFNAFRRRHHCRICGQIFCSDCCNREVPGKIIGFTGSLRVCNYCCKVVLHYAENLDDPGDDLENLTVNSNWQRILNRESSESLSRTSVGQSDAAPSNTSLYSIRGKSYKPPRLSSIFDEELIKRSHSSGDLVSLPGNLESCCEDRKPILQDPGQLRDLWLLLRHPTDGVAIQTQRYRRSSLPNCMLGRHIVDWLLAKNKAMTREQSVGLGQVLLDAKWIESAFNNDTVFRDDFTSYRPAEMALRDGTPESSSQSPAMESDNEDEPQWFKEIKQMDKYDQLSELSAELNKIPSTVSVPRDERLDIATKSVFFVDGPLLFHSSSEQSGKSVSSSVTTVCSQESKETVEQCLAGSSLNLGLGTLLNNTEKDAVDSLSEMVQPRTSSGNDSFKGCDRNLLSKLQREHVTMLIMQMLHKNGLSSKWADTILVTSQKVSHLVRPDVRRGLQDMDIRQYVRIKKVPGGVRGNTSIINGVVCTKNVAHKKMRQDIANPRILLLRAPIEYQRVENKFSSLEPQILQENEFLKNCISRIATLQPDILLVEKTVSRLAQNFLLDAGITLVLNVKASVMERVARMTRASIATSIDGLVAKTTMGSCGSFHLQMFTLLDGSTKTLMYFDGCDTHLGCTVTLRGGPVGELRRVKQIMSFIIYAAYHSRMELEYLLDEMAIPPQMETILDRSPDDCSGRGNLDSPVFIEDLCGKETVKCPELPHYSSVLVDKSLDVSKKPILLACNGDPDHCSKTLDIPDAKQSLETSKHVEQGNSAAISRKEGATTELVTDLSDPLHSYQMLKDEAIFNSSSSLSLKEDRRHTCQQFKKVLGEIVLTTSPCIKYDIPYLETEAGSKCKLRAYFPAEIFRSEKLDVEASNGNYRRKLSETENVPTTGGSAEIELLPPHPFVTEKLSLPLNDFHIQAQLADFRARGGRIPFWYAQNGFVKKTSPPPTSAAMQNKSKCMEKDGQIPADCLDPIYHQRISLLFSSFSMESANFPNLCVLPWIITMSFYGQTDMTLGGFLEKFCFSETYRCVNRACDTQMIDHVRRFVHGNAAIEIIMKKIETPVSSGSTDAIYVWSWCRKCKQASAKVPLSGDAYHISFAKYMELRFHGNRYLRRSHESCRHSLHHDHFQYFGNRQMVASVKYSTITLREVVLPPIVISIQPPVFSVQQLEDEGKMLHFRSMSVFHTFMDQLHRLKKDAASDAQSSYVTKLVIDFEKEKDSVTQKIEYVQSLVAGSRRLEQHVDYKIGIQVEDALVEIKHQVAEIVTIWNDRIKEVEQQTKKFDKSLMPPPAGGGGVNNRLSKEAVPSFNSSPFSDNISTRTDEDPVIISVDCDDEDDLTGGVVILASAPEICSAAATLPYEGSSLDVTGIPSVGSSDSFSPLKASTELTDTISPTPSLSSSQPSPQMKSKGSNELRRIKGSSREGSSQDLEKKVEKPGVKQIISSFLSSSGSITVSIPFSTDEHHLLYPKFEKVPVVVYDQEPSSIIAYALSCQLYGSLLHELKANQTGGSDGTNSKRASRVGDGQTDADVKKGGVSFVRAAASQDRSPNRSAGKFQVDTVMYTPNSDRDSLDDTDEVDGFQNVPDPSLKSSSKSTKPQPQNFHIELQFSDCIAKFYCRVCYAEQFTKLRKLIFPDGEERYIRSLSRCFTWLARGGKSGSSFCKTQDDRFILKQMSRIEVQSFSEFAPYYFQYLTKAYEGGKPTALAKILGVYRIGYQNSKTGTALKQDLLVMENLFYGYKISQIYDLKGSSRNRLVNTSGKRVEDMVLLDENLIKSGIESPLYVYPHSKNVLMASITKDTEFLANHSVMDYSLLVGANETKDQFVIGIIDYIRTFTWDKKVEMIVKTAYGKDPPTVVSPEAYKRRFLDAMDRYFLMVPDQWHGLWQSLEKTETQSTDR